MKKLVASSVLAAVTAVGASAPALADFSANIGFASEYYFRGILQKSSSGSAGLDFEAGGFYVGTWAADVGDGLEVDGYFGYNLELGEFNVGAGFTGYYYTGEFDDTYEEINLFAGWRFLSVAYSIGEYDGTFDDRGGDEYDFLDITLEYEGFYGTFGRFGKDADGDYIELGYGTTVSGIDLGIAAIFSSDELSDQVDDDGDATESEAIVFSISKSFDL